MKRWYALYTKPHAEEKVQAALTQKNITTFLPQIASAPAKARVKPIPLFPNYLFMYVDLQHTRAAEWRWTPGLQYVVSFDNNPVVIPERAIQTMQEQLVRQESGLKKNPHGFKPGDKVRIKSGPFADMIAIIEQPTSADARIKVLLKFLGRMSRLQVDVAEVEKAPSAARVAKSPSRHRARRCRRRAGQEG